MVDLTQLADFHFIRPWWLLLLLPVVLLYWLLWRRGSVSQRWGGVIAPHLLRHLVLEAGEGARVRPEHLLLLAYLLIAVALAGPTWRQVQTPLTNDRTALVIALDLSPTMNATDIQPSRLQRAQQKVRDLLAERGSGETGLIVYAGTAHMVLPLTDDSRILEHYLNSLNTAMMPVAGKEPGKALRLAEQMLAEVAVPGTIVFLTDGISQAQLPAFVEHSQRSKNQVLCLAIGTAEGGPVSIDKNDYLTDAKGQRVISALEREGLEALADQTGAYVTTVTVDDSDVRRINRRIQYHLTAAQDANRQWQDFGYYLVYPLALLTLFWFRRGWAIQWSLALVLMSGLFVPSPADARDFRFADLWLTPDQQGRYYFTNGDYVQAAERFQDPMWKGIAYYADENFEAAIEQFSRLDTPQAYFNLGNAYAHSKKYLKAVQSYDEALVMRPDYEQARFNRDELQSIIDTINAMSDPTNPEATDISQARAGDPDMAEGVEEQTSVDESGQSDADALQDEKIHEMWMRQIQPDPATFLRLKFSYQSRDQEAPQAAENE